MHARLRRPLKPRLRKDVLQDLRLEQKLLFIRGVLVLATAAHAEVHASRRNSAGRGLKDLERLTLRDELAGQGKREAPACVRRERSAVPRLQNPNGNDALQRPALLSYEGSSAKVGAPEVVQLAQPARTHASEGVILNNDGPFITSGSCFLTASRGRPVRICATIAAGMRLYEQAGQTARSPEEGSMKSFPKLAVLSLLLVFFVAAGSHAAQAQIAVGVGVGGPGYGYGYGPPACEYGYYGYAPYSCAPYGYYGPNYFVGGLFIGAGPWFRGGYGFRGGYYGGYRGG